MQPQVYTERDGLQASSVHLGGKKKNRQTCQFSIFAPMINGQKSLAEGLQTFSKLKKNEWRS